MESWLSEISSNQLGQWMEYAELEPFGHPWQNWLMAVPAYQFVTANTSKNASPPKFKSYFYESKQKEAERKTNEVLTFGDFLDAMVKH